MIVVDHVHKRFGNLHAVQGVSFALRPGQIAGLLGHNGAGKTTTIRMITSCIMPDAGCVRVGEHDTRDARHQAMRLLGYLPEATPLYHEMPVEDYLHYRGRLWSMPRKDRTRAIARVLERCWLRDVSLRRIGTLSKGYKQRVGLASALLHDPPALVLDEPTNGLDPTQVHETRSLVRELAADRTVLLSSHILTEVEKLCDRVVIIAGGVVKADGSPSELAAATGLGGVQLAAFALEEDKSSAHALAAVIAAMEGVTRVSQQWGQTPGGHVQPGQAQAGQAHPRSVWTCFVQSAGADTQALREQIALAALAHRVPLHLVREQRATLEQVFAHATDSAGASAANTAPTSEPARPALAPPASLPHAASWDAARREVALSEQQLRLRARLDAAASAEQSQPPATLDGPRAGGTP
jgi:ABC-2 type transport system ATP-binding protein